MGKSKLRRIKYLGQIGKDCWEDATDPYDPYVEKLQQHNSLEDIFDKPDEKKQIPQQKNSN